jgi:uncharacterized protein YndB with AHSA1/START domain
MNDRGTLLVVDGRPALRFERRYRHGIDRVWRAITEPDELRAWFPSNVEGDRVVGAELRFVDDDQRAAAQAAGEPTRADGPMFTGRVLVVDPPKVFSFTWGGEVLRFELHPDGDGTRLVFTQLVSHQSVAARNGAGWHACLAELDRLLGEPVTEQGWESVYDDYLQRIGPSLGEPTGDGGLRWERATHVDPDVVRAAVAEPAAWGAGGHGSEALRWAVEPAEVGSRFTLVHDGIGADAELAATWHALLIQLDMYLAAGQLVPVDPKPWVDDYRDVLDA